VSLEKIVVGTAGGLRTADGTVLSDADVTAMTAADRAWWVLAGERDVHRIGGGDEKASSMVGPPGRCLIADGDDLLIGTAEAHLMRLSGDSMEPVVSFDRADGRDAWYTPWGGPPDTRSLSRGPDGILYANIHVGGILRSRDRGATWTPTLDIDDDVHQVLAHPTASGHVFAAAAVGLLWSVDGGDTWARETVGLHATYARADAVARDTLLLTASEGPRSRRAAVYRRSLAGGPFERCSNGLPEWFDANIDTHRLAASGSTAAFGTDDGRVFVSEDEGRNWELVDDRFPPIRAVAIEA
jgi:hypothetical protein